LSGGGFRGLYTARILADLEQHVGEPLARRFDLIAGTSIGGILALALALEVQADRMVGLFEKHGEEIFRRRFALLGMLRSSYTQEKLRQLLEADDLFGQRPLGVARHRVIVPAINYSSGRPVVFKTPHHPDFFRDAQHRVVDIALATSAAPGYFPRHLFGNNQYVDGGLFANAPGLLAVHEALCFLGQSRRSLRVVAIGTMSAKFTVDPRGNREGGMLDWGGWNPSMTAKRLFGLAISAQESLTDFQLRHRLPAGHYFHIDEDLTDERARAVALDKANAAAREVLLGAAAESSKKWLGNANFRTILQHRALEPGFIAGTAPR
jgi:predicted acylesterase/phospholipase RssA